MALTGGGVDRGVLVRGRLPVVGDLTVIILLHRLGGDGGAMVFPELPLELALVGGLRPEYLLKAVLGEGVDVPGLDALRLHPHDESYAHAHVLVLGTSDVVGELQLRPGTVDVGFG